jgi:hypothetical protein
MRWLVFVPCLAVSSPAFAETLTFSGSVTSTCSIETATDGELVLTTSGDALTSETAHGGTPGTVEISAIGTNRIDISAPVLTDAPGGYDPSSQVLEVAFSVMDNGEPTTQGFTDDATEFTPASLSQAEMTIDNRIRNPDGFAAGDYDMQTVVTCVPLP